MRIVIIGTGGRVGGALSRHFRLAGHSVVAFDRTALDLSSPELIEDRLAPLAFDALLIPAALTSLEYAEAHPKEAQAVNVYGPGLAAALGAEKKARVVFFSTDYVYDGTQPGLRIESDACSPVSVYARTKADGEQRVLAATDGAALIARVSWIFGPDRPAFPDQILQRAASGAPPEAVADKFSMPTSALDLSHWLEPFLDGPHRDFGGPLNFCQSGPPASWHSYAQTTLDVAASLGIPIRHTTVTPRRLEEVRAFVARRPVHTAMDNRALAAMLPTPPRPWPDALRDYLRTYHATA
jgi:dTDP-4-dehydrorhamnose reductase